MIGRHRFGVDIAFGFQSLAYTARVFQCILWRSSRQMSFQFLESEAGNECFVAVVREGTCSASFRFAMN